MADHLKLLPLVPLRSKRRPPAIGEQPPFDRRQHATNLRGILEGLERRYQNLFEPLAADDETDARDMGEIVFKFTGARPFGHSAFSQWKMRPLAADGDRHFFVLADTDARVAFRSLATEYDLDPDLHTDQNAWRTVLENVVDIELYGAVDRLAPDVDAPSGERTADLDIVLWPTSFTTRGAKSEAERRVEVLRSLIEAFRGEDPRVQALALDTVPDRMMIHARLNRAAFDAVIEHPYVEAVRGPLAVSVSAAQLTAGAPPEDVPLPEGAPIGVIDDLVVDANPWLAGVVVEQRNFPDRPFGAHTKHGTQVAGLAAWGNGRLLLDPTYDGQPHPLYVARVAQANDRFQAQLVENSAQQISDALDWFAQNDVKVVVCAFAFNHPDDGAIPSDLSAVIDEKAREHDLVIVLSAGNLTSIPGYHWKNDYPTYLTDPAAGIAAPGSAALGLTVGSVAHDTAHDRQRWPHGVAISPVGDVAPFSRTGPSRAGRSAGRMKPEFAAHGGTWAWDQAGSQPISDDPNLNTVTLIPPTNGRIFGAAAGTSYAAPLVAHEVARIATRYPDASANLLRALTALAGERPKDAVAGEPLFGFYGVPEATRIIESGSRRAVFVYEGEMDTNSYGALEIPVPEEFAAGSSERELRIALAFDPPVRRSRRDYIAGKMTFALSNKVPLEELQEIYATQPSLKESAADPTLTRHSLPPRVGFRPTTTSLSTETLVCRTYWKKQGGWDPDDGPYYLMITHDHSPWTQPQKNEYARQRFAVAVTIEDYERSELDLHALAEAKLRARARSGAVQNRA